MALNRKQTGRSACRHRTVVATAMCLLALGGTTPAAARTCLAAPGTSAVDQYCETFPSVSGSRRSEQPGGERLGRTIAPNVERALTRAGSDGRSLLTIPAADAPSRGKPAGAAQTGTGGALPAPSSNAFTGVASATRSGTTVSDAWIWILAGVAAALAGLALMRRRRSHRAGPPGP